MMYRFQSNCLACQLRYIFFNPRLMPYLPFRHIVDDATNAVPCQLGAGYFGVICAAIFGQDGVIISPSKSSAFVKNKIPRRNGRHSILYVINVSSPGSPHERHRRRYNHCLVLRLHSLTIRHFALFRPAQGDGTRREIRCRKYLITCRTVDRKLFLLHSNLS